jgi:alkylation response protein AidB-like acyl-CoA dehydrogenase
MDDAPRLSVDSPLGPSVLLRDVLSEIADRANVCDAEGSFPTRDVAVLGRLGLLRAFAPAACGGYAFHDSWDYVDALFDCLRLVGRANLSLGRIFEGHINAVLLVDRYGDDAARARLKTALSAGKLFGVWNTEPQPGMTLEPVASAWRLAGSKNYATGAGHLDFAVITARLADGSKQMLVLPVGEQKDRAHPERWRVSGMRATVSGTHDFSGLELDTQCFLGGPGDYEREPMFTAGAWRFTAVQLGGIEALTRMLRDHIAGGPVAENPIHRARFARVVASARTAFQWVREAARRAELNPGPSAAPFVLMTRGIVEDAAFEVIEAVQRSVGTRAFFSGNPIDRMIRDLQLYLRQPVPDQARDRAAAAWLEADLWSDDPWW